MWPNGAPSAVASPAAWLRDALALAALQWDACHRAPLLDGEGLGLGWLTAALRRLFQIHDACVVDDLVAGALHTFRLAYLDRLGPPRRRRDHRPRRATPRHTRTHT
ncbi:hypothetical protein [Sorangium sp. So ce381]|uniref:hypothetical protein n=1 Tax=Sorangium sp. So ce381 TaxID=3133307 RepID=UPI003F5AE985